MVKKSELNLYHAQRTARTLVALNVKKDDELIAVYRTDGKRTLMLATHFGYGLRFSEEEVSLVGQRAAGVKGINLKDNDFVVSAILAEDEDSLIAVTHRGAVKKMSVSEFEKGSRAKRGLIMLRELKRNPHRLVQLFNASRTDEFVLTTEKGDRTVISASSLRNNDRYSNGSFIVDENEKGNVVQAWKNIVSEEV